MEKRWKMLKNVCKTSGLNFTRLRSIRQIGPMKCNDICVYCDRSQIQISPRQNIDIPFQIITRDKFSSSCFFFFLFSSRTTIINSPSYFHFYSNEWAWGTHFGQTKLVRLTHTSYLGIESKLKNRNMKRIFISFYLIVRFRCGKEPEKMSFARR